MSREAEVLQREKEGTLRDLEEARSSHPEPQKHSDADYKYMESKLKVCPGSFFHVIIFHDHVIYFFRDLIFTSYDRTELQNTRSVECYLSVIPLQPYNASLCTLAHVLAQGFSFSVLVDHLIPIY